MRMINIAGYKFITLSSLPELRAGFVNKCSVLQLKGTILLSTEGINLSLAGTEENIQSFKAYLQKEEYFTGMTFRQSYSASQPFKYMRVKIKKEIINLRQPDVRPDLMRAPSISPKEFKQWLDEKRDITVLDTRNEYEISFGTFANATHLQLEDFCEFPSAAKKLLPEKTIVMFCTGGIRCEKAALYLLQKGFPKVYQLEGGILNYFAEVGSAHYQGECFVFDQRVSVDTNLDEKKENIWV